MGYEMFIFWFWESPTTGWHACKVKKHFHCLIICIYYYNYLLNDSQRICSMINFSKPLCVMLICGDWSHFHFIMPVMPDKGAFVSAVLLCVQRYRGNFLTLQKQHLVAKNELAFSFRPMRKDQQVGGRCVNVLCWHQHETTWDLF